MKDVSMCVTTMYDGPQHRHPVELSFPPGLTPEERKRIRDELEATVVRLGYVPTWIPVL